MSNSTGEKIKITVFGQSHAEKIGVVIDGLPAGKKLDIERIDKMMSRRAPGKNAFSTTRSETDFPTIISGLVDDTTCGAPLCATIDNNNTKSQDYSSIKENPRPSHADYPAYVKFNGFNDIRGGGCFSGRLTAPLVFAGGVCEQFLEDLGIKITSHIYSIGSIEDDKYDLCCKNNVAVDEKDFPVLNDENGKQMQELILQCRKDGDSIGGVVECAITGVRAGIGDPMFDGIENIIAKNIFAIPAVKGIEFGLGFGSSRIRGSQNNDEYKIIDGEISTTTNNAGGICGGITTSMPIVFRVAFKPTPSIAKQQNTVNLNKKENSTLVIHGRHDPCIVQRALVAVEAVAAFTVADLLL